MADVVNIIFKPALCSFKTCKEFSCAFAQRDRDLVLENKYISFYSPKVITTHISNLRRKLKIAADVPEYIKSVRGVGYKFEIPK